MSRPVLIRSTSLRRRGFDSATRQHADQMRAIFGAAVQIAVQSVGRNRDAVEHLVREALLQGLFERLGAEYAVRAGAGDGDTHVGRPLGDEYADQRIARSLVAELDIGRLLWQR